MGLNIFGFNLCLPSDSTRNTPADQELLTHHDSDMVSDKYEQPGRPSQASPGSAASATADSASSRSQARPTVHRDPGSGLNEMTLLNMATTKVLKPDSAVVPDAKGSIGYFIVPVEPSLVRIDRPEPKEKRTMLRPQLFLIELHYPLLKPTRGSQHGSGR